MASVPPPSSPYAFPHPGPPPPLPERPEGAPESGPRWPAWTAPVALIAGFGVALFGYILVGGVAGVAGADLDPDPPPWVNIVATVIQDLALIGSALFFAQLSGRRPRARDFGLRRTGFWSGLGWMVAAWISFFVFTIVWVSALGIEERDDLPDELGADESTLALIAVGLLVTVVAPIAEEFFFRGFFFTALRSWRGIWPAAIVTGLVFGGIHGGSAPVGYLVPLAVFGMALCLLYVRTGSLFPCIALHALNNSLAFGVSQDWDWQIPVVMLGANAIAFAVLLPFARGRPHGKDRRLVT
ncbi:MAG TPA: CPBP family intramembrane glutamic endopeptidase [Solirubrobacteraceae bacterium]|nr:CPBP family intramembrane glutamic endopeptidase [Solirubrobacteraceae bacterium]